MLTNTLRINSILTHYLTGMIIHTFSFFVEFIPTFYVMLRNDKCMPSTTTNFISPKNTCQIFRFTDHHQALNT
jgi:hypothetical protein